MYGQAFPKYPKIQVFNIFAISVKRSEIWSWLLEHQSFLQGNRNDHENVKGMVMGWSSVLKVLKVQVCNVFTISLKKVRNRLQYGVHQDQNFCKSDCQFLMKARHFQSTRKRKFANFLPNFKKKNHNCFWCFIVMPNIKILYEVPVMFVVAFQHSNFPDLPGQSWFLVYCSGLLDWINLSRFLYFSLIFVFIFT